MSCHVVRCRLVYCSTTVLHCIHESTVPHSRRTGGHLSTPATPRRGLLMIKCPPPAPPAAPWCAAGVRGYVHARGPLEAAALSQRALRRGAERRADPRVPRELRLAVAEEGRPLRAGTRPHGTRTDRKMSHMTPRRGHSQRRSAGTGMDIRMNGKLAVSCHRALLVCAAWRITCRDTPRVGEQPDFVLV